MTDADARRIGYLRVTIGFVQGVAGWLLLRQAAPGNFLPRPVGPQSSYWSNSHPMLFAALALITSLVPIVAIAEVGRIRGRRLLTYLGLAVLALAGLAVYDIWRAPQDYPWAGNAVRIWPSFQISVCTVLGLFIVNQLLEHRERGAALFDQYALHFEDSWMRGFQLAISLIFSGLAWAVLNVGALLFGILHLDWFRTLIDHNWFRCPFLAMAFAIAIHVTDVRPALLKGMRNVVLTLLSWLLPLVVVLCLGFLVALCFVGLKPLWETRHAAAILLWTCALTTFLLNAAYKDGDPDTLPPGALRLTGQAAGPVLVPLALLAFYAIALRVHQYGWTPGRLWSIAVALMALLYTGGYLLAALSRKGWLKPLERVNVCASVTLLGLLIVLLTPIADPARLSVDSQIARLARGTVAADEFDYQFLRFDSGRYGHNALAHLAGGADARIRDRALRMQAAATRQFEGSRPDAALTESALSHATIYPQGTQLPPGFKQTGWLPAGTPECLRNGRSCDIFIVAYGAPGEVAVIVHPTEARTGGFASHDISIAHLYERGSANQWTDAGILNHMNCPAVLAALRQGNVATTPPTHDDLLAAGTRLQFTATAAESTVDCEGVPPHNPRHTRIRQGR